MNRPKSDSSSTETMLLAMIDKAGLTTPYALLDAGLPPGLTGPLLHKLRRRGLIERGARESRGKRPYALTAKGEAYLRKEQECWDSIPASSETVQRRLWVGMAMGISADGGRWYLDQARADRIEATKRPVIPLHTQRRRDAGSTGRQTGLTWDGLLETTAGSLRRPAEDPLRAWLRIRAVCESHRLEAEARAYEQLRAELGGDSTGGPKDERDGIENQ